MCSSSRAYLQDINKVDTKFDRIIPDFRDNTVRPLSTKDYRYALLKAAFSSDMFMGLLRYASIPDAKHFSLSPSMALAVTATVTIGTDQ